MGDVVQIGSETLLGFIRRPFGTGDLRHNIEVLDAAIAALSTEPARSQEGDREAALRLLTAHIDDEVIPDSLIDTVAALLSSLGNRESEGMVLVPCEITPAMLKAWFDTKRPKDSRVIGPERYQDAWEALLLAAAPHADGGQG